MNCNYLFPAKWLKPPDVKSYFFQFYSSAKWYSVRKALSIFRCHHAVFNNAIYSVRRENFHCITVSMHRSGPITIFNKIIFTIKHATLCTGFCYVSATEASYVNFIGSHISNSRCELVIPHFDDRGRVRFINPLTNTVLAVVSGHTLPCQFILAFNSIVV